MTTAVAIQPAMPRPAPVPIAAARPSKQHNHNHNQNNINNNNNNNNNSKLTDKENAVAGKPVSSAGGPVANIRTRRERPCDACRRRKSRCVIHEGAVLCVLCEFHKQECTFVQSPLPRKRKVVDGDKKDSPNAGKKRYVELVLVPKFMLVLVFVRPNAWPYRSWAPSAIPTVVVAKGPASPLS